jgi:CRP/FNR family transcriptional regulator, cyclic AMP receptor protein
MNASSSKPPRTAPKAFGVVVEQPFFRGLSQAQLRTLADSARQTWFESDELIFREGDTANRFYLIVAGKVALEVPQSPRPKQWIAVCRG